MIIKKIWLIYLVMIICSFFSISFCDEMIDQEEDETIGIAVNLHKYTEKPEQLILSPSDAYPVIISRRNEAIVGNVLFFTAVVAEQAILNPWAMRINDKFSQATTNADSLEIAQEALGPLIVSLPVGIIKIIGPTIACAGASHAYGAYLEGVSRDIPDIQVWKPYIIGWVLGAVGGFIGTLGSLGNEPGAIAVGSYLSLGRDISWSVASVWSVVNANQRKHAIDRKRGLSFIPYSEKGYGFTFKMDY